MSSILFYHLCFKPLLSSRQKEAETEDSGVKKEREEDIEMKQVSSSQTKGPLPDSTSDETEKTKPVSSFFGKFVLTSRCFSIFKITMYCAPVKAVLEDCLVVPAQQDQVD